MKLPGGGGMSAKEFVVGLKNEISHDNVTDLAAALTYYGVLALFPFVLFLVALASVVIHPDQAEQMVQQLGQVAPGAVTQIIGDRIRQLGQQQSVGLLTVGALGALWAASGGVTSVMKALNVTYDVTEGRPFWKVRLIAIGMTLFCGILGIVAALLAVAAGPIAEAVGGPIGTAISWLRLPAAGLVMMLLWATLYYVLPDVEQKFKFITPGSVAGVVVWVLASWGFSAYVSHFGNYDKTYGSLGGVIVLLLWMWISSLVLLVGAESNALIEHHSAEGKPAGGKQLESRATKPAGARRVEEERAGDAGAHANGVARGGGKDGDGARGDRRGARGNGTGARTDGAGSRADGATVHRGVAARGSGRDPRAIPAGPGPSPHGHPRLPVLVAGLAAGLFLGTRRA